MGLTFIGRIKKACDGERAIPITLGPANRSCKGRSAPRIAIPLCVMDITARRQAKTVISRACGDAPHRQNAANGYRRCSRSHGENATFSAKWLLRLVSGCARKFFLRRYFACIQIGR